MRKNLLASPLLMTLALACTALAVSPDAQACTPCPVASCGTCTSWGGPTVTIEVRFPDGSQVNIPNVPWIQNETVSLAMSNAQCLNTRFTYEWLSYCPYGGFLTSINGVKPGPSRYWALYINGSLSRFGMDTAILNSGDVVRWQVNPFSTEEIKDSESHQHRLLELHHAHGKSGD